MRRILNVMAFATIGITLATCGQEDKQPANASGGPGTLFAEAVLPVHSTLVQKSNSTGSFIAEDNVVVSSEVAGYLQSINFKEGEYKSKSSLLGKINDDELQARKSKLQVQLNYAREELARAQKLVEIEAVSREELDKLQNDVDLLNADIHILDVQIKKTNIYAPFSGRIGVRSISEGAYVTAGTKMAELYRTDPIKLEFYIPEKLAGQIRQGDDVTFSIPASKDTFSAKIYLINPSMDENNRSLRIRCRVDNKANQFMPGGYADVYYSVQRTVESLLIPAEAIIPVLDGQKVLLSKNGKVVSQKVEVGMRTSESVQILSGITERDTVLVTGILSAVDGAPVKVTLKELL